MVLEGLLGVFLPRFNAVNIFGRTVPHDTMVSEISKQKRKGSPPIPGRIAFKEEVNHLEWCSKFEIVAEIIIVS